MRTIGEVPASYLEALEEREERYKKALEKIRDHWANQYDHPRKEGEMYRGPYGIGITDGHRACAIIAEAALTPSSDEPRPDLPFHEETMVGLDALSIRKT